MKLLDFITLILKHKIVLVLIPLLFGVLGIALTSHQTKDYYSQTILYTGIASGSTIEMDKKFNYLATNNAFDNLINIIKSRDTQEEVAIRLLTQHLMLQASNSAFISKEAYKELQTLLPKEINSYIVRSPQQQFQKEIKGPKPMWNEEDYEATVANLMALMARDNTNFVYSLLNFDSPYYSLEAMSKVKAERMSSSDLIKLSYITDDPGICQQTLKIYIDVCTKKYKDLKENGSDAVVKYFQFQLKQSEQKLKSIEQKLLAFNQDNNIINYYEQSKAVAIVKEDMNVAYRKGVAQLAGTRASVKRLENKLAKQELIQQKNNAIIESKKRLGDLNYQIGIYAAKELKDSASVARLKGLQEQSKSLEKQIQTAIDQLYSLQNSIEGVPLDKVMPDWVDKVVETEDLKAKLEIMKTQNDKVQQQFAMYAPAGAHLKRIEREIEVAEQEYLEILHGLSLAKLKFQDTQLSSNLKAVDPPYFPLKPNPSKRKIIIIALVLISGIIVLATILVMKFFDDTLKNEQIAAKKLQLPSMGMLPRISKPRNSLDLIKVQDRLLDFLMHNFRHTFTGSEVSRETKVITVFSTRSDEGKTTLIGNMAKKLKSYGNTVLFLNHLGEPKPIPTEQKTPWVHKLLGYQDPRIDFDHPFLAPVTDYLEASEYATYEALAPNIPIKSYKDLGIKTSKASNKPIDYVFIELPNVLENNYPADLIAHADLSILVCRSNRLWSKADENILNNIKELSNNKLQFIINGVELEEVESLLGELPKKRSVARRKIKNLLRLQFYNHNHI